MIYIYNCFGGTHSSVLAASYHLNQLDGTREPTSEEILNSFLFNKLRYKDRGKLYFHGVDENGDKVYTVGKGRSKILIPGFVNLIQMLQIEQVLQDKIIISDCLPTVPLIMKFGGLFSRWLSIDSIGVPLLILGSKQTYRNIVSLVQNTKNVGKASEETLIYLDNQQFAFPALSHCKKNGAQ